MEDVIKQVAARTRISRTKAERAVGVILRVIRDEGDETLVRTLFDALPEAEDLVEEADMGEVDADLDEALGDDDDLTDGADELMQLGLDEVQIQRAVSAFVDALQDVMDEEQTTELIESVPALSQYM